MALEIERKFLIDLPKEAELNSHGGEYWEIVQTYLRAQSGVTARVRQVTTAGQTRYYHTEKRRVSDLTAEENEREITDLEYLQLFQQADPALMPIRKRRWRIPHEGHVLEVDVYPFWTKTAVLEVELDAEEEAVALPSWLTVRKDVTGDVRFKNVSLARLVPEEATLLCE